MFELIGYLVLRILGFGWVWGARDYECLARDGVYGNGGALFLVGLGTCAALLVVLS